MELKVHRVQINHDGWRAEVKLGEKFWFTVICEDGELSVGGDQEMRNIPAGYDRVLEQVEEMLDNTEVPEVETDRFGDIK